MQAYLSKILLYIIKGHFETRMRKRIRMFLASYCNLLTFYFFRLRVAVPLKPTLTMRARRF